MADILSAEAPKIAPIQLFMVSSDADYHTLNESDEINRSNVTDEANSGFSVMVDLEKAIHGEGQNLNSFIGLHFSFRGASDQRRFKSVTITIRFEDEEKPLQDDPEVIKIWPDTEYIWNGMNKEIEDTRSIEGGLQGGISGGGGSFSGKWQRQEKFVRNTPARLSGERTLLKRKAGSHKNAIFIRMSENTQERSGVFRELRAGILVARKREGNHRFKSYITIKAVADMRFDVVKGLKKLVGKDHVTDPIVFEPGNNFVDAANIAGINGDAPSAEMVQKYGEVASWTELINVSRKITKENGEWEQVDNTSSGAVATS